MSLSRTRTDSSSSAGHPAAQHSVSPRLPRKSRQSGSATATGYAASKHEHSGSLQVSAADFVFSR